jgi:hypothetical protein
VDILKIPTPATVRLLIPFFRKKAIGHLSEEKSPHSLPNFLFPAGLKSGISLLSL